MMQSSSRHDLEVRVSSGLGHRRSLKGNNIWSNPAVSNMTKSKNSSRIDLTFMFNLRSWMLWSPVWLPMIFVITPPLSEYCNLRTLVFLLFFIRWNQRYLSQWTHLLKNASWSTFLHAIFVPRLWPTRIEIHCDTCESNLAEQLQIKDQVVGWKMRCMRRFPWRILSRQWGILAHTKLKPHFLNAIVIYIYAWLFDCKIEEAERSKISQFESLGDFFVRTLKPGVRPVDQSTAVVSPADGTATFNGSFKGGFLEQVKGVHYSLPYFLGLRGAKNQALHAAINTSDLLTNKDGTTSLFQAVVYLSPGDYHRFHSPVEWTINTRRHFPGELLSVKTTAVNACPGLFHLNERVAWIGNWQHGFFSMTAVGATNVGSIHMDNEKNIDPELKTNQPYGRKSRCEVARPCSTRSFYFSEKQFEPSLRFEKGQAFGHFSMGSTIVLIFEAPKEFSFSKGIDQRVIVGAAL